MLSAYLSNHWLRFVVAILLTVGGTIRACPAGSSETKTTADSSNRDAVHPLDPALKIARASLKHIQEDVRDYTARFEKRARVDGVLSELQSIDLKVRHRRMKDDELVVPMSVYLGFLGPDSVKGREVLWVEGQYGGKLVAHETGMRNVMNFYLDPTSYLAMRGQRHPITEIGIEKLTLKLIDAATRDREHGECEVQDHKNVKVGDDVCDMIEVLHPVKRDHFDYHRARVYFSRDLNLPIRYASWSWPLEPGGEPILEEEYTYRNVRINVGLDDRDFDVDNPDYRFW